MGKDIVKYSNKMNKIPLSNFTKYDLNFFYSVCSQVKEKGEDVVYISFGDIREMAAYTMHMGNFIEDIKRTRDKVLATQWRYQFDSVDRAGNLFSTFDIDTEKELVRVRVNVDFLDYFNALVNEFTVFELEQFVSLDSKYTKILYRLLKQWRSVGETPKYTVDDIKELLGTPDYAPMILMRDIIKPSIEELKKKKAFSNLWVDVRYKKGRGKPIDGYVFKFRKDIIEGQQSFDSYEGGKYMPTAAEPTTKRRKKNSFNEHEQQNYDIDVLEQQIVANLPK